MSFLRVLIKVDILLGLQNYTGAVQSVHVHGLLATFNEVSLCTKRMAPQCKIYLVSTR